jgi:hypothetical protein
MILAGHAANVLEYTNYLDIDEKELRCLLMEPNLDLCNIEHAITEEEFLNIFARAIELSGDNYFGLHYGF